MFSFSLDLWSLKLIFRIYSLSSKIFFLPYDELERILRDDCSKLETRLATNQPICSVTIFNSFVKGFPHTPWNGSGSNSKSLIFLHWKKSVKILILFSDFFHSLFVVTCEKLAPHMSVRFICSFLCVQILELKDKVNKNNEGRWHLRAQEGQKNCSQ